MTRIDLAGVVLGFLAFEYGIAHWSPAAAWAVGGLMVMVSALWPTRKADR